MKLPRRSVLTLAVLAASTAHGQRVPESKQQLPLETTVCKILEDPSAYNNKLVKVKGFASVTPEYSLLEERGCSEQIWLALHDSAIPGLVATINGQGSPGGKTAKGAPIPPLQVHLVKDSNYRELVRYLEISAKGEACLDEPPSLTVPDCRTNRVSATFTGRIDGVSKQIHEAHRKQTSHDSPDFRGFGHMGLFDAQLVVQTVENVVAVEAHEPTHPKKSQ
jgi:hypothetical protein